MNLKEIIKQYRLIILLVAIIFILAFIKLSVGDNEILTTIPTPTSIPTQINQQNNYSTNQNIKEELSNTYKNLDTDKEKNDFWNKLSEEEQTYLSEEEPTEEYNLEGNLPYETDTFVAEKYATANVLVVKSKGSDFDTSQNDVKKWLEETADNPEDIILVWEEN